MLRILQLLIVALLLLFIFNRFSFYIDNAAQGELPASMVLYQVLYRLPDILLLLLPLSLILSMILSYEQLFVNNEVIAMFACGLSRRQLLTAWRGPIIATLLLAFLCAFYLSPLGIGEINRQFSEIKNKQQELLKTGEFYKLGQINIYIDRFDKNEDRFENIFIAGKSSNGDNYEIVAKYAKLQHKDDKLLLWLGDGVQYEHRADGLSKIQFDERAQEVELSQQSFKLYSRERTLTFFDLIGNLRQGNQYIAQFLHKISQPLMLLLLVLIIFNICDHKPRHIRFKELLPALILFSSYFALLDASKDRMIQKADPSGFLLTHALFATITVLSFYRLKINRSLLKLYKRKKLT